jgi:hypothetical protein
MLIDTAGRCMMSICLLAVPLEVLYFLRQAAQGNEYLVLFGFLIALTTSC